MFTHFEKAKNFEIIYSFIKFVSGHIRKQNYIPKTCLKATLIDLTYPKPRNQSIPLCPLAIMISCDIYNAPISPGITGIDIGGGFNRYRHEAGSFDHLLKERLTLFIENPEAGPKIRIFFYFVQKTLWVNYFQKYCLKVPARLMRNLRKLEIPPDRAQTPNNGRRNFCKIEQFQHASTES